MTATLRRLHIVSADCWCTPVWVGGHFNHRDDVPIVFEPSDGDQVDADGFSAEDHR